jgi:hypothetical protein
MGEGAGEGAGEITMVTPVFGVPRGGDDPLRSYARVIEPAGGARARARDVDWDDVRWSRREKGGGDGGHGELGLEGGRAR